MSRTDNGKRHLVAMIGIGTMESIPVYHFSPGGLAVRAVYSSIEYPVYKCDAFPICVFGEGGRVLSPVEADSGFLLDRARAWSAWSIFLDGLEPLNSMGEGALEELRENAGKRGLSVGARSLGLVEGERLWALDYLVIDYMRDYALDPSIPGDAVKLLYKVLDSKLWVEVSAYLKTPDYGRLQPLVVALEGSDVPLHVFIEDHRGGGPVRDLYEKLRERLKYVYIHNDLYPELDTVCPNCGAPVASRSEGVLRVLEVRDGSCWKCGYKIPLRVPVRKKTPEHLLLTLDEGGVKWYHPSQLVGGAGYWLGLM